MFIRQLFDQQTNTYTYLLADRETGGAAIIDPVREQVERDTRLINELGLQLKYVLETHIHADHATAATTLRERFGAKIVLHQASAASCADLLVKDGDVLKLGNEEIKVLHTPGHTDADITYQIDGAVFTGDALLIRGCGRTDFQAGDAPTLYQSVTQKIFTLPDSTAIYPGHDYRGFTASTVGEERTHNPRLGGSKNQGEFVAIMDNLRLDPPTRIKESVPANRRCGIEAR